MITAEAAVKEEAQTCNALFEAGLSKLHIRKPHDSKMEVQALVDKIKADYHDRISIHEHHELTEEMNLAGYHIKGKGKWPEKPGSRRISKSFHSLDEVRDFEKPLSYGFLSPVFHSISKIGYLAGYDYQKLQLFNTSFKKFPLYALGGISDETISQTKELGFAGAAALGFIWQKVSIRERVNQFVLLNHD